VQPLFAAALASPEPLAIVIDTSALYGGVMTQIVRMRSALPLHLAAPDTTFMEVQTHLEDERKARKADVVLNTHRRMPHRLFRRVKRAGAVLHFIRPPEALVRLFGHERSDLAGRNAHGEALVQGVAPAPNHHRDRLIIEAARELKRSLADVPVWIATCDQNLALQADMEGFHAGLAWVLPLPDKPRYTSPWIEPHTLSLQHVEVSALLADILWTFDNVALRPDGAKKAIEWRLPSERRDVALHLLAPERDFDACSTGLTSWPAAEDATDGPSVPVKAPAPVKLVETLLAMTVSTPPEPRSTEVQYLVAMGWASPTDDAVQLTADGKAAAEEWRKLRRGDDADAWCSWVERMADAIRRLPTVQKLVAALKPGIGDDKLGTAMGVSERSAESQAVLAGSLGVTVRLNGKNWAVAEDDGRDEEVVLECAIRLRATGPSRSTSVRTDQLFTALLPTTALPLYRFRRAIMGLTQRGSLQPGGSTQMTEQQSPVKLRTIVPGPQVGTAEQFVVDLGAGTFLLPGQSSQVLAPAGHEVP
jgi:hypothetical protein